jgi:hypothetical protein
MLRVQQARITSREQTALRDLRRMQCVDEAGISLAMTRLYGRAPKGERSVGSIPLNYGEHITRLGTLGVDGLQAVMTVEGATDAAVFRSNVQQVLGPTLAPGDIVVLNNLSAHKAPDVNPHKIMKDPTSRRIVNPFALLVGKCCLLGFEHLADAVFQAGIDQPTHHHHHQQRHDALGCFQIPRGG